MLSIVRIAPVPPLPVRNVTLELMTMTYYIVTNKFGIITAASCTAPIKINNFMLKKF